jgi:antitoxin component YwqK of YwqJK toxin-antitoxin module
VPEARLSDKAPKDADRTVADECSSSNEPVADTVIVRYPNGKPKIKKSVTRNKHGGLVSHGPFAMWDPHGNMIANGHFAMGKRHGVWSRLLPQRTAHFHEAPYQGFRAPFVWETRFEDDVLHGGWLMLDAEGRPMHSWGFDRGRLHGQVIDWYSNGKKRMEAEYEQGILNGNWQEWDQEGAATVQVKFVDGCRCRQYVEKHANGIVKVEGQLLGPAEKVRVVFNWWEGTVKTEVIPGKGACPGWDSHLVASDRAQADGGSLRRRAGNRSMDLVASFGKKGKDRRIRCRQTHGRMGDLGHRRARRREI